MNKDSYKIYLGDSREYLKKIADNSIDCVITDPPYFIDGMDSNWQLGELEKKKAKANVIGSLPVGMKFDPEQGKKLQIFMEEISVELYRILKPGGFYLSFSQARLNHRMAIAIENSGFEIRDMFVWAREGQPKAFSQTHFVNKMNISKKEKEEIIKSLNNRKTPQLKGQFEPIILAQKPKEGTFVQNWIRHGVGLVDCTQSLDGKFPGTIMNVEKPKGKERLESSHLTLKPVKLMEHLVKLFTKENDTILDPFSGSATTGVACLLNNRKYIGIELDKNYYKESLERLKKY